MASYFEDFWEHDSFAVVGHSTKKNFPVLTYRGLKARGKTVFPVDPSTPEIDGDPTYPDLGSLPDSTEALVLELPKDETLAWVASAADAGIQDVWIHMNTETRQALELADEMKLNTRTGHCAVMYLTQGFSYHSLHRWGTKLVGEY